MFAVRFALVAASICACAFPVRAEDAPHAKNIIVMVADGWSFNDVDATDYFQYGEKGSQVYEKEFTLYPMSTFPVTGSYDPQQGGDFDYLMKGASDSAAAATTMSSGNKTLNGAIGMGPDNKPVEHAIEVAEKAGKATGVITSVQWSHATPAGFTAHDRSRGQYEAIAHQMLVDSACEVIMGAGHPWFGNEGESVLTKDADGKESTPNSYKYVGGETLWREALAGKVGGDCDGDGAPDPWTVIQSKEEFEKLMTGETPKRVLGTVQVAETLQESRASIDGSEKDDLPFQTPLLTSVPTLAEMSLAAINVLDNDPDGFYLMIEGGAVDWASHSNETGRMIEEMIDYNRAIEAVVQWVSEHSSWDETLVVITGDHECGFVLGPDSKPELKPVMNNGKGNMPGFAFYHKSHTNQLIPCYVKGVGSEMFKDAAKNDDPTRGKYIDNADIGLITKRLMMRH